MPKYKNIEPLSDWSVFSWIAEDSNKEFIAAFRFRVDAETFKNVMDKLYPESNIKILLIPKHVWGDKKNGK